MHTWIKRHPNPAQFEEAYKQIADLCSEVGEARPKPAVKKVDFELQASSIEALNGILKAIKDRRNSKPQLSWIYAIATAGAFLAGAWFGV